MHDQKQMIFCKNFSHFLKIVGKPIKIFQYRTKNVEKT